MPIPLTNSKFEFVRQLSADPNNTVIGFARNKQATEEKIEREMPGRSNIHTIQGEIENYESVKVDFLPN